MAWISKADYETVAVSCEHCGELCVFNRREDFADPGPYAGENVTCTHCQATFRMVGDTVNPAYELFMFAAREHFEAKRYMLAVGTMAQAWEVFFATFAAARYVYSPFFASGEDQGDLEKLNGCLRQLDEATKGFSFAKFRNLLTNTVAKGVAPQTLDRAEIAIQQIVTSRLGNDPPQDVVAAVGDPELRNLLNGLLALTVGPLRNRVLHQRAYRPLRHEVEQCLEDEAELLYRTKHLLKVGTLEDFAAGAV
jgi:hypothetical protein